MLIIVYKISTVIKNSLGILYGTVKLNMINFQRICANINISSFTNTLSSKIKPNVQSWYQLYNFNIIHCLDKLMSIR